MSVTERPDLRAVHELQTLVRRLGEELAAFRKRAIGAEARLREITATEGGAASAEAAERVSVLAAENAELRRKLASARDRARGMLEQVRFLRQQAQAAAGSGTGGAKK